MPSSDAATNHELSRVYHKLGRWKEAVSSSERAVAQFERLRGNVRDPALRATYFSDRRSYYDGLISSLIKMAEHSHAEPAASASIRNALVVSDRSRSRLLGDLVYQSKSGTRSLEGEGGRSSRAKLYDRLVELRFLQGTQSDNSEACENCAMARHAPRIREVENRLSLVERETGG